jgi:hypothetical protein
MNQMQALTEDLNLAREVSGPGYLDPMASPGLPDRESEMYTHQV